MFSIEQQQLFEVNELDKKTFTPSTQSFEQISLFKRNPQKQYKSRARPLLNPLCCCTGQCNLRINCMVNAVIIFTLAFWLLIGGINRQPKHYDCTSTNKSTYVRIDEATFRNRCSTYQLWRVAALILIGIGNIEWVSASALLLWGAYKRVAWAVLPVGILIPLGLANLAAYIVILLIIFANYPQFFGMQDFLRTRGNPGAGEESIWSYVPIILIFYTPLATHLIWMSVCAFELRKQIKAGLDCNPARDDNWVDMTNYKLNGSSEDDQVPTTPPVLDPKPTVSTI